MKEMIKFFGGLRFRNMDLFRVSCVRLLLDACAETLETLRIYPTDPYGETFHGRKIRRTQVICRKRQCLASTFQPVPEQIPPDIRDHN